MGKQGVKRTKENHQNYVQQKQREAAAAEAEAAHFARVGMMDLVTIALGRLGFNEDDFREFDHKMTEVAAEYSELIADDAKDDPDLWYSSETRERELRQYVGSLYVPVEERYG